MDKIYDQKAARYFTESERRGIIEDYLSSNSSKAEIWRKYTGMTDHGFLLRWMRELGYNPKSQRSNSLEKPVIAVMAKHKKKESDFSKNSDFETLQLKKRISELEKQLKDAEMKAIAFSTMVDIAEEEFKIPIRKKLNTKP
jgi:transposase-like protein